MATPSLFSFSTLADPAGALKAEIQSKVGEFLQMNARLRPYLTSSDPQTAQVANAYMATQQQLEAQLPGVLAVANTLTASTIFGMDGLTVGTFATKLTTHMSNVNAFLGASALAPGAVADDPLGVGISSTSLMVAGGIVGLGVIMGRTMLGIMGGVGFIVAQKSGVISVNV
jgi:hypothetical protein